MNEVLFLRSENQNRSEFSNFSDLKKRLEQDFDLVHTSADLEELILSVNGLLKSNSNSFEEKNDLKRLRQKAYDKRRMFKAENFQKPKEQKEFTVNLKSYVQEEGSKEAIKESNSKIAGSFLQEIQNSFLKIDVEKIFSFLPRFTLLFISLLSVSYLVWLQSLSLYSSSGFIQPELTATGALFMMIGFAAYHASSRSFLSLILCLYAGGYETYFMASGTFQDETVQLKVNIENDQELIFLKDKTEKSKEAYLSLKTRHEDPSTQVYANDWFKKKHLDPAWDLYEKDQKELSTKKHALTQAGDREHVAWLKVLYRLGLVFLCMVLTHRFVFLFCS